MKNDNKNGGKIIFYIYDANYNNSSLDIYHEKLRNLNPVALSRCKIILFENYNNVWHTKSKTR